MASIATLVIVFGMLHTPDDEPGQVQSIPAQPNTVSQWVAAPAKPSTAAPQPKPAALAMDDHGFVDTTARCDEREQAVAIARTTRSAMVVCEKADGTYEYAGIRLHDGASLRLDDVRVLPAGFEAHNDGTTYRLSPTELVVIDPHHGSNPEPVQRRCADPSYGEHRVASAGRAGNPSSRRRGAGYRRW